MRNLEDIMVLASADFDDLGHKFLPFFTSGERLRCRKLGPTSDRTTLEKDNNKTLRKAKQQTIVAAPRVANAGIEQRISYVALLTLDATGLLGLVTI
jgi:hypothetical protein